MLWGRPWVLLVGKGDRTTRNDSSDGEYAQGNRARAAQDLDWETPETPDSVSFLSDKQLPEEEPVPLPFDWNWRLILTALSLVLVSLFGWMAYRFYEWEPTIVTGLQVEGNDGLVTISWDPESRSFQGSSKVSLRVRDGEVEETTVLTPHEFQSGRQTRKVRSGRLDVALEIGRRFGKATREMVTYLGRPLPAAPTADVIQARAETEAARKMVESARTGLEKQRLETKQLEEEIAVLRARPSPAAASPEQAAKPKPKRSVAAPAPTIPVSTLASVRPSPTPVATVMARPPAAIRVPPPSPTPTPTLTPTVTPTPAPAVPVPTPSPIAVPPGGPNRPAVSGILTAGSYRSVESVPPPVPISKPFEAAPRKISGKFLWTGELPKEGVLTIEGGKASRGHVNGAIPGFPIRIGAYPAEVSAAGIQVLTQNPRYGDGASHVEAPASHNGWNQAEYRFDPRAARALVVMEAPGSANGWNKLVLRAGNRKLSAVVIEWEAVNQ